MAPLYDGVGTRLIASHGFAPELDAYWTLQKKGYTYGS